MNDDDDDAMPSTGSGDDDDDDDDVRRLQRRDVRTCDAASEAAAVSCIARLPRRHNGNIVTRNKLRVPVTHILETCAFLKPFLDRAT